MKRENIKKWLHDNNFDEIIDDINLVEKKWKEKGKHTRRNWWEVLAGCNNGNAKTIEGIKFPVFNSVREREGKEPIENAYDRDVNLKTPDKWYTNRWPNHKKKDIN